MEILALDPEDPLSQQAHQVEVFYEEPQSMREFEVHGRDRSGGGGQNSDPLLNRSGENWVPGQRSGLGAQVDALRDTSYHLGSAQRATRIGSSALGVASSVSRRSRRRRYY